MNDPTDGRLPSRNEVSRPSRLASGAELNVGVLVNDAALVESKANTAFVESEANTNDHSVKEFDIPTNGINLHVTEQGEGPVVLFCHGFPDTAYTWRRQMQAVATAGYRAIAD